MISFEVKTESSSTSSPLNIAPKEEEGTLSFSELLRGVRSDKDEKVVQNGILLALDTDTKDLKASDKLSKNDILLGLLKGDKELVLKDEPVELNTKIATLITPTELKVLIKDAKIYLKNKIVHHDDFKKLEIKELPRSLKGLAQLAKKIGIDVSKITVEEVQVESKNLKAEPKTLNLLSHDEESVEDLVDLKMVKLKKSTKVADDVVDDARVSEKIKSDVKSELKRVELPKEIKAMPLFKAQSQTEHSTQQIVQTKLQTVEQKTPKQKADETLQLLLRGEKVVKREGGFTADFSVATARVIAPSATTETGKSLESLLRGDAQENTSATKLDGLATHKADSFEVKLNEAKQMIKYLSQDVKTAIEDYKSPFTRVKVQLNPQKLGEVDLTIVQRGKNLHINLSSNNVAINTLAMNANDLKVQLQNSGINNASLNFNNNAQSENSQAGQQQQQRHSQQKAETEYNYFDTDEANEEILNSLEIVVPRYI